MDNSQSSGKNYTRTAISWFLFILFFVIGVLNLFLIHPVPGAFYLFLSLFYFPRTDDFIKNKFGFTVPFAVKMLLALVVLWATLGVGDLMELFESQMRNQ